MDTSFTSGSERSGPQPDAFAMDLNDAWFVPGDTVCFYFHAVSIGGAETYWSPLTGSELDEAEVRENPGEVTILPAGGYNAGGDILYVDGMNARGAQPYFDTSMQLMVSGGTSLYELVDRYDLRGPSSGVGNRPGARVVNTITQLIGPYRKIIWNTGNLDQGLIGDGTVTGEKSDDAQMLWTFLDQHTEEGGIYFNGDNIAEEIPALTGLFVPNLLTYMPHTLVNGDHVAQGYAVSPLVIGEVGGMFDHSPFPPNPPTIVDTMIAYGGCALINDFDVLAPAGASTQEMKYDGGVAGSNGAIIATKTVNAAATTMGVVLSGFSFHYIRDDGYGGLGYEPDRAHHLRDILVYLENTPGLPTSTRSTDYSNSLSQNYPNPFNPTTSIDFTVKELAPVTVKIYNVRGQLVKNLVNDRYAPGVTHKVTWDGRNDAGEAVSSGVYFYKLVTKNYTQTKKMVLLK
jgi:hypothetical protein